MAKQRQVGPPRRNRTRRIAWAIVTCGCFVGASHHAWGQAADPGSAAKPATAPTSRGRDLDQIIRRSATGVVSSSDPVEATIQLKAVKTNAWKQDDTHVLLLDRDAEVAIGSYGFKAKRAVVMLTPRQLIGRMAHEVNVYLENVTDLGGYGPTKQQARRLLVTALIVGPVELQTDAMDRAPATSDELVASAMSRVARHRQALAERTVDLPPGESLIDPAALAIKQARQDAVAAQARELPPDLVRRVQPKPEPGFQPTPAVPTPDEQPPVFGLVDFNAGRIAVQPGEHEDVVVLAGGIQLMYTNPAKQQRMTLTADNAVLFLAPGAIREGMNQAQAAQVRGVYLEDNVVLTNGDYTLRGPRIFYDIEHDRAIVLDAVFFTWNVDRQIPIYVRADEIRQASTSQWSATNARLSTSEFHEPHFSIGANKLTITRDRQPGASGGTAAADLGAGQFAFDARDANMRFGQTPVFYWPSMTGNAADLPLRAIDVEVNSRDGAIIETRWDMFGLLNAPAPKGVDAELLLDGYTERGPATGVDLNYDVPRAFGQLESYFMYDDGKDEPGGRERVDPETEFRGKVNWQHRHYLPDGWELTAEAGWVSDPTFLEEFFRGESLDSKEYETVLYLKKQEDDWAFSFLTRYDLMDHIPTTPLFQTRGNQPFDNAGGTTAGYTTQKLPELAYYRIGTPLLDDRLTWYSENRLSSMRLNFPEVRLRELGYDRAEALALFGIMYPALPADDPRIDSTLRMAGLDQDIRYRLDTRQELQAPMKLGDIDLVPYVTGRVTAYDDDFGEYNGETSTERLWGGVGLRAHTSFTRTYDGVENSLLDIHRVRHIIEPHVNVMFSGTSIEQDDLPVYDYDVESVADGALARVGMRQTFQTQRGGPNHWRSVDFLRVDTDFIIADDATQRESPIARFFDYRPELSLYGNHFWSETAWQVTDTLSFVGNVNHNFDTGRIEQWNLGMIIDHSPRFSTFAQLRSIEVLESMIVRYGFDYILTPKYHISVSHSLDIEHHRTRNMSIVLTRRLPRWLMMVAVSHDPVGDISSIGIAFAPEGFSGRGNVDRNPFLMH